MRIAGVVNTLNESHNIRYALGTLGWCDDLVVVDQHSSDGTPDIARAMGARVFQHERTGGIGDAARAFAVEQADADWVLILDADEMIPPALARYLREQVSKGDPADVFLLPRANIIMGRMMRHGTNWPSRRARFFRPGAVQISGRIHHGLKPLPGVRVLQTPARIELAIWHFSYADVQTVVDKVNRYTTIEANQSLERGEPAPRSARRFLASGARWFWTSYVRDRGYRDGTAGLILAVSRAYYRFLRAAKMWEASRLPERERQVLDVRERLVAEHGTARETERLAAGHDRPERP
ncbi:MAG: glycosyltransferase family 2 protein [Chloroflexota bacterium]|nr:glycosyltransferase family 2 protein [Chloroflexota bacterium]